MKCYCSAWCLSFKHLRKEKCLHISLLSKWLTSLVIGVHSRVIRFNPAELYLLFVFITKLAKEKHGFCDTCILRISTLIQGRDNPITEVHVNAVNVNMWLLGRHCGWDETLSCAHIRLFPNERLIFLFKGKQSTTNPVSVIFNNTVLFLFTVGQVTDTKKMAHELLSDFVLHSNQNDVTFVSLFDLLFSGDWWCSLLSRWSFDSH